VSLKNHFVYVIKRPSQTGDLRTYIGVTSNTKTQNPKQRWACHKSSKTCVGRFIRKYPDAFMEIIFSNLTKKQAYAIEKNMVPGNPKSRKELFLLNERGGGICPPNRKEISEKTKNQKSKNISKALKKHYSNKVERNKRRKEMLQYHRDNPHLSKEIAVRQRTYREKHKTKFKLISSTGEIVTHNDMLLIDLAKKINAPPTNLYALVKGKVMSIKGWRLYDNKDYSPPKTTLDFCLKSPDGEIHVGTNVKKFCKQHKLDDCYIRRMVKGFNGNQKYKRYKSHRGWIVFDPSDQNSK
jgi:hypothetical protein